MSTESILFIIIFTISLIYWIRLQSSAEQKIGSEGTHDDQEDRKDEDDNIAPNREEIEGKIDCEQDAHIFDLDIQPSFRLISPENSLLLGPKPLQGYPKKLVSKESSSRTQRYRFRPEIQFRPKTRWDRLSIALHMTPDVRTDDDEFDHNVFIETFARPELLNNILCDPIIRKNILVLLSLQDSTVLLYSRYLPVVWQFGEHQDDIIINQKQFDNACELLNAIHHALPPVQIAKPQRKAIHRSAKTLILIVSLTFGILSLGEDWYHTWQVFNPQFEKDNFFFALYMYLLTLPVLFFLIRGSSKSLSLFAISSLLHGFNMVSFVPPYFLFFNAFYDKGTPNTVAVEVLDKWIVNTSEDPRANIYYVRVDNSEITPETEFVIDRNLYQQIQKNVHLHVGRGFLSQKWLVKMEPFQKNKTKKDVR